jgi:hypothetical protein
VIRAVSGSFAESVLLERHPKIIRQVLDAHPYPPHVRRALEALEWPGTGAPFFAAEVDFYQRLLEAVGYFSDGPWHCVDPFGPQKAAELAKIPPFKSTGRAGLLHAALLGNRADLGFRLLTDTGDDAVDLLADDSAAVWAHLDTDPPGADAPICILHDNAGTELLADLLLADELLQSGTATRVELHLKPQPTFVSDATLPDLLHTVAHLRGSDTGARIWQALADGRLEPLAHPFFCQPLTYEQMPDDLRERLSKAKLTIAKGDLNYRRLVGDEEWPVTDAFADRVAYFPSPVLALRTLKSDVIVGLSAVPQEPGWRTSGRYAVIQFASVG